VEIAFEAAKVSWLRKHGVVGICHVVGYCWVDIKSNCATGSTT
jgi:hypothetical protein